MNTRLLIRLVFVCLWLSSCSIPGFEQSSITETPPKDVASESPTATTTSESPVSTPQATAVVPTNTPELPLLPTLTPLPDVWYALQAGTPLATFNTVHEAAGCSWLGVGGQVFGTDYAPILGVNILAGGTLEGYQVGGMGTTGMETNIGEGGYEITLADHPVDSTGTVWVQVVNDGGEPLSEKISFDTMNNCEANFILINFVRYQPALTPGYEWTVYLPVILHRSNLQGMVIP
jgi:hypothetical protein